MGWFTAVRAGLRVVRAGGDLGKVISDAKHRKEERENGNVEKDAERAFELNSENLKLDASIVNQYAKEFKENRNWFDSIIDGINRIPRPAFALVALVILISYNSAPFVLYFSGQIDYVDFWDMIKILFLEQRWFLTAVVLFYFGARTYEKGRSYGMDLDLKKYQIQKKTEVEIEKVKKGVVGDSYVKLSLKDTAPDNVRKFYNQHVDAVLEIEKKYKLLAVGVISHAGLECGWGEKILKAKDVDTHEMVSTNNIFNIKVPKRTPWNGGQAYRDVWEDANKDGKYQKETETEKAYFKVYSNLSESFEDYAKLLTNLSRYDRMTTATNAREYGQLLKDCGYMTDGKAAEKIEIIANSYFNYET